MKIPSLLMILFSLSTLICGQNDRSDSKKPLTCDQGFWKRKDSDIEHSCYEQSQKHQYKSENKMKHIRGRNYLHLTSFIINNEQYQVFTDRKTVIVTKWNEDDERLHEEQKLHIKKAYSAEVIFHDGHAILLVAVYNIGEGCKLCDQQDNQNPSRAFLWDHSSRKFKKHHFQNLPSTRFTHSFPERYHGRSTVISVFTRCDCDTKIFYLDINNSSPVFYEITQDNALPFRDVMVVQSVRSRGTQYILFAPLNRSDKNESISIFNWTQSTGSLTFHRNLSIYINEDTGLSTTVFNGNAFLCSVSEASKSVRIYRLKPDQGHLEEMRHIPGEVEFSMCNFFTQGHELYTAIGFQKRVQLLQYSPVTKNFINAGHLPRAENTIDLICFQSRDDTYIVTAGNYKCKKKTIKSHCRNKVYRKDDSLLQSNL